MAGPWNITEVEQEGRTLLVRHTNSSRLRRGVGRDRRSGRLWDIEDTFPATPRFDRYGAGKNGSRPTSASSAPGERGGTAGGLNPAAAVIRKANLKNFQEVEAKGRRTWTKSNSGASPSGARSWTSAHGGGGAVTKEAVEVPGARGTFTSLLRAAIASAQRAAEEANSEKAQQQQQQQLQQQIQQSTLQRQDSGGDAKERSHKGGGPASPQGQQRFVTLDGRQLGRAPRRGGMPVAWANRQFYDSGLGLGPRLPSFETPGPGPGGYRMEIQNDTGSVALWNEDAISLPNKQPLAQHKSTIANRFGCRRGDDKVEKERAAAPGPGYYKHHTFVDEILAKRKPKRRTLQLANSWCSIP